MSTTLDRLLDGRVVLRQGRDGYRAGMDAGLLAAALDADGGETLAEFGCGAGAALLCAAWRLDGANLVGVERDPAAAGLAGENAAANGMAARVRVQNADITQLGTSLKVDQVFFNPPFFDDPSALRAPKDEKRAAWLTGDVPFADWVRCAARALKAKGRLTLIHRADRLADILTALDRSFGSVVIKPVHPRAGEAAKRVIVRATVGGKSPLVLLAPLILHEGEGHSTEADAILRGKAGVEMAP
ncbi:tRNA1(Val) (adenine(37)-N6)-methyltransferase [Maricaulis sp.]|uniref:tRNA1(Val) (adenine(37)-N6)-methyltransferase n=1 Tax=Maricaulis sp. TaxID=1486257 RepID=UPI002B275E7F|nr:methyltransferase [Maricaulis sp.]